MLNIKTDAMIYLFAIKKQFRIGYFTKEQITRQDDKIHRYCISNELLIFSSVDNKTYYHIEDNTYKYLCAIQRELIQYMS